LFFDNGTMFAVVPTPFDFITFVGGLMVHVEVTPNCNPLTYMFVPSEQTILLPI